jgi:hypothetical protein
MILVRSLRSSQSQGVPSSSADATYLRQDIQSVGHELASNAARALDRELLEEASYVLMGFRSQHRRSQRQHYSEPGARWPQPCPPTGRQECSIRRRSMQDLNWNDTAGTRSTQASMSSLWHHIALALAVSVSSVLMATPPAFGQTTATDTTAGAPSDSLVVPRGDNLAAPADTGPAAPADTVDTLPRTGSDSVPAAGSADTARSPSGSLPSAAARDTAPPAAPVDRTLSAACGGPGGSAAIARDLLVVVFAPEASARERAAAAESVGGKVLGPAEPGAYYIKLPAGGGEAGLRAAADQLSLVSAVRQVGSRACPSTPP